MSREVASMLERGLGILRHPAETTTTTTKPVPRNCRVPQFEKSIMQCSGFPALRVIRSLGQCSEPFSPMPLEVPFLTKC